MKAGKPLSPEMRAEAIEALEDEDASAKAMIAKHGITYDLRRGWVGVGWEPLVDEMFTRLIAAGWDRELRQVKEKFGLLRVYLGAYTPALGKIIARCEDASAHICEDCGAKGEERDGSGWIRTLCAACEAARAARRLPLIG